MQNKTQQKGTVTHIFFFICQRTITCAKWLYLKSITLNCCVDVFHSWLEFVVVSIHVFVWTLYPSLLLALPYLWTGYCVLNKVICGCVLSLCLRKVCVLTAIFSKNFRAEYWHKFPSNFKLAQSILRRKFLSKCKPSRIVTQISLGIYAFPNISPSKNKPLKKGFWEIYFRNVTVYNHV